MSNKSRFKAKFLTILSLLATLTSTASAQISGSSNVPGTDITIDQIINTMLFWDLGSGAGFWTGLVMFIATWAGFYFASKPLFYEIYGFILDNFPTSDRRNRYSTTDDGEPMGMRGLALTSSFVTAQVVGQFFGLLPMIALGGIGLLVFLYSMIKGTQTFRNNFNQSISGGENQNTQTTSNNVDLDIDQELESMKNELKDELARDEDIKSKINRLRGEKEDFDSAADELLQSGDLPDNVEEDLEYLRNEMDDELQKEFSLAGVLDEVVKEEESELEELNNVGQLVEYIKSEFSHIVQLDNDLDKRIESMEDELNDLERRAERDGVTPEVRQELNDIEGKIDSSKAEIQEAVSEYQDISQKVDKAMSEIEELSQQVSQTEAEVEEAESEAEEVKSEAVDEEKHLEALKQDRKNWIERMEQAHGKNNVDRDLEEIDQAVSEEEEVASEESDEADEEYDEMMKLGHEKDKFKQVIQQDHKQLGQTVQELKQKTDELQAIEQKAEGIQSEAEAVEMEEEEFNREMQGEIENLQELRNNANNLPPHEIIGRADNIMNQVSVLVNRMPSEIRNREEERVLRKEQNEMNQILGETYEVLNQKGANSEQLDKFENLQKKYFPLV